MGTPLRQHILTEQGQDDQQTRAQQLHIEHVTDQRVGHRGGEVTREEDEDERPCRHHRAHQRKHQDPGQGSRKRTTQPASTVLAQCLSGQRDGVPERQSHGRHG